MSKRNKVRIRRAFRKANLILMDLAAGAAYAINR